MAGSIFQKPEARVALASTFVVTASLLIWYLYNQAGTTPEVSDYQFDFSAPDLGTSEMATMQDVDSIPLTPEGCSRLGSLKVTTEHLLDGWRLLLNSDDPANVEAAKKNIAQLQPVYDRILERLQECAKVYGGTKH